MTVKESDRSYSKEAAVGVSPGVVGKVYSRGTLKYTIWGLVYLGCFLFWGDFCYALMEASASRLMPIALKDHGTSNILIGVVTGSIPGTLVILLNPTFSMRSDRHRGRFGRRIPFLLAISPLAAGFLILVGYSSTVASWLNEAIISRLAVVSSAQLTLGMMAFSVVAFCVFDTLMSTMYNCLFADVVPQEVMGRFLSIFRMVGMAAEFVFARYLFGFADRYIKEMLLIIGTVYLVSFLIICWRVKEGTYPPPSQSGRLPGFFKQLKMYGKECFTVPFYFLFFLTTMLVFMTGNMSPFAVFFFRDELGMTLDDIGKISGWCYLASAAMFFPAGYLCDRLNPVRLTLIGIILKFMALLPAYFFIHDWNTALIYGLLNCVGSVGYGLGWAATCIALLPREKYAQFYSSMNIMIQIGGIMIGNTLAGLVIDIFKDYRLTLLWPAVVTGLAIIPMVYVYRGYLRYGGPRNYIPPVSDTFRETASPPSE